MATGDGFGSEGSGNSAAQFAGLISSAGVGIGSAALMGKVTGSGDIKGKSATDRRIREQYQTMVNDLRLAGLNPALAYQSAKPTGTATGTAIAGQLGFDPANAITAGIRTQRLTREQRLLDAQHDNVRVNTAKTAAETEIIHKEIPKAGIQERLWQQIGDIVNKYMDRGVSPKGAEERIKNMFQEQPSSAFRTNDWQRNRPRYDSERRLEDYRRRNR